MSKFCLFHAALSLLLLPAAVMPAHNREDRQTFSVHTFKTPARDYGPMTWWHWINGHITREGIRKDLSAMHDAGLRGVQVFNTHMYLPKGPVKFGSEEWHGMISYALHVCDSLGMKFCITPGAGWSGSGGPWITAEQSMKKLTLSETFVSGGKTDTVLAMPETKGGYYREIAVQAVPTGIQAGTVEDLQAKIMAASKTAVRYDYSDDSSRAVRCDEIIDLTGSVDRDGRLECVLPDGDWCILRFGYTITGKKTHPAAWGGEGYEVDKLDSTDVLVQYEHYLKPLFEKNSRYLGNTFEGILFDSYEAGFQNWTERLPEEFTKMHGYDLLDYMPVFSGRPVESMKVTEQVLYDFRELLDHMLSEFYYGTLKKKINAAGLAVYAEPQGGPVPSMAMDFTDIPMNEFWNPDAYPRMKNMRLTASLADIRGKKIVGAEAFTSKPEDGRWKNWPGTLKKPGDLAFICGINRFCFHTYAHQPVDHAPGFALGRYGTMFSRLSTWWDYSGDWIAYLSRCQYMLQQGIRAADIAFLFNYDIRYSYNTRFTMIPEGYDYRVTYPEDLEKARVEDRKIIFANGAASEILFIVPAAAMDMKTMETLLDLTMQGAVICGEPPAAPASYSECLGASEDGFDTIVKALWPGGGEKYVNKVGKGRVLCGYSHEEAIEYIRLPKDVDFGEAGDGLYHYHKKAGNSDMYFISNQDSAPKSAKTWFRTGAGYCSRWDPVSGDVTSVRTVRAGGMSCVDIELDALESAFFIFSDEPLTDKKRKRPEPVRSLELDLPWTLTFEDRRQTDTTLTLETLIPVNEMPEPELKYYSGTMVYSSGFTLDEPLSGDETVHMTFEDIHDICEVIVNGSHAGFVWTRPYRIDIGDYVRQGENSVCVRVADSWINRIIGDEQYPDDIDYQMNGTKFTIGRLGKFPEWLYGEMPEDRDRITFYTWKHYQKDSETVPSGLSGEVKVEVMRN